MNTRVLIVDDTALFRRVVSEALSGLPNVEIVGTAVNGKAALAKLESLKPDLLTLDIEMPEMGGVEVLEQMLAIRSGASAVVLSANTERSSRVTMRALELGAFDFLTKPEGGGIEENILSLRKRLIPIIRALECRRELRSVPGARVRVAQPAAMPPAAMQPAAMPPATMPPATTRGNPAGLEAGIPPPARSVAAKISYPHSYQAHGSRMVLIGVSTGGPSALGTVLPALPATLDVPVFIVQHMPPIFTRALAETLQSKSAIRIQEAVDGETAKRGVVYIAPGGRQMKIKPGPSGEIVIEINDDPPENHCRPSVDYLFRSAALNFPGRAVAAILTGMGNDGTQGLRLLKRAGCYSVAQDEASCVVFGMPREAILAGVIDSIAPLDRIAALLLNRLAGANS